MNPWLLDVVREAGAVALREIDKGIEVITKPNGTPVTSVDLAVDRFLGEALLKEHPDDVLLSEERPDPPHRLEADRAWIVDPIDGTSILMRRQEAWGILVACWSDHAIVESVAHFPVVGMTLHAKRDEGCFVNGRRVHVSNVEGSSAKIACTVRGWRGAHTLPRPVAGHSLEVVRVATGELEGCLFPGGATCGEHDYAWADCALREAGGMMTDEFGNAVRFNKPVRSMPRVLVCSNGRVHEDLLETARARMV